MDHQLILNLKIYPRNEKNHFNIKNPLLELNALIKDHF